MAEVEQISHFVKHDSTQEAMERVQEKEKNNTNLEVSENNKTETIQQPVYQVRPHLHEK